MIVCNSSKLKKENRLKHRVFRWNEFEVVVVSGLMVGTWHFGYVSF
jgi:hypothetical protein